MDALKALVQQKQAIVASTSSSTTNNKKKRYLTASQRRQIEQEEEERQFLSLQDEAAKGKERKRRNKRKRNKHTNESDNDEEDEDLTTLLTTKRYHDKTLGDKKKKKLSMDNTDGALMSTTENRQGTQLSGHTDNNHATKRTSSDEKCHDYIMESLCQLSQEQVTNKLRSYGLPVRLFGEITTTTTSKQEQHGDLPRLLRLHTAIKGREEAMLGASEKDEFLLDSADRTRNVFLEKEIDGNNGGGGHHDAKNSLQPASIASAAAVARANNDTFTTADKTTTNEQQQQPELTKEEQNDKPKRIYRYFKSLLRQWEAELNSRPDAIKRTMSGKNETKTLKQCKDYIRPLFTLCKRREIEESLQNHLFNIVLYCEQGEFVKAHDAYLDVAIGRAAWPIGVTMVGIHARSGRAKIESANVAHVMNSELQRKYLTSVKRLMSFAQRVRVDVDPSKKVVNL